MNRIKDKLDEEHICYWTKAHSLLAVDLIEEKKKNAKLHRQITAGDYRRNQMSSNCYDQENGFCGADPDESEPNGLKPCEAQCGLRGVRRENNILIMHY